MTYLTLTIITLFLSELVEKNNKAINSNNNKYYSNWFNIFILIIIITLCVSFSMLRNRYNDTGNYIEYYYLDQVDLQYSFLNYSFGDPLVYDIIKWFCQRYDLGYHVMFLIHSLIFVVPSICFLYKHSSDFVVSILLFMCLSPFLFSMVGMKHMTAVGFALVSYMFVEKKKYFWTVIFAFLTFFSHSYAFVLLAILFVSKKGIWNRYMTFLWVLVGLIGLLLPLFEPLILELLRILGKSPEVDELFAYGVSIPRFLIYFIPFVLSIIYRKDLMCKYANNSSQVVIINLSNLCSMVLYISLFAYPILFGRLAYYFAIFYCVGFANIVDIIKVKDRTLGNVIKLLMIILFIIFNMFEISTQTNNFMDPFGFFI